MRVGKYATHEVVTTDPRATVFQAATLMRERHVGDLIVVKSQDNLVPVGIITDRDIIISVVSQGLKPEQTAVADVMTSPVVVVNSEDQLTDALRTMSDAGVRRAPVIDERGLLRGIVAMDDLISVIAAEIARVTRLIRREQEREVVKTEDVFRNELAM